MEVTDAVVAEKVMGVEGEICLHDIGNPAYLTPMA